MEYDREALGNVFRGQCVMGPLEIVHVHGNHVIGSLEYIHGSSVWWNL